jgi:hypothetical protein
MLSNPELLRRAAWAGVFTSAAGISILIGGSYVAASDQVRLTFLGGNEIPGIDTQFVINAGWATLGVGALVWVTSLMLAKKRKLISSLVS